MSLTLHKARALLAGGLILLGGAAWLALSVFRPTEFTASGQHPSTRALTNPFYVFSLLALLGIALRVTNSELPEPAESSQPLNRRNILLGTALLLFLLLANYAGSLALSPLSDDFAILFQASQATATSYRELFTRGQGGIMVRPVGLAVLMGEYRLWGLAPQGYRLVSLLMHFAAALGLGLVARDLGLGSTTAWAAAALFALHPIHPESTIWIASLISVQTGACVIWALHCYLRFRQQGGVAKLILSLVLAAAGMLSKETGFVLLLLVITYDLVLAETGRTWGQRLRHWAPYVVLVLGAGLYRVAVVGGVGGYRNATGTPSFLDLHPVKTIEALFVRSPALSLLAINWSLPRGWLLQLLAVLWVLALTAVVGWWGSQALSARRFSFLLAWIVLAALPAHHLLLVGGDLLGARNLYLSAAGGALLLAMVVTGPASPQGGRWLSAGALLVLLGLYCAALQHNLRAWKLASNKTERILNVIVSTAPKPPAGARFWVVGLPKQLNGVYMQTVGLAPALNLRYGRRDLQSESFARAGELPPVEPGTYVFRWDAERQELEPVTSAATGFLTPLGGQ